MLLGELIGERFRIERQVARGGMGTVYRALDQHTEELAAVKTVQLSDERILERFAREARLLAELRHPGIVQYLAHGRTVGGELYLAMEWLDGEDLEQRLAARGLTVGESVRLVSQVAAALAVAHARRVVHRDLKPSNLFLVGFQTDRVKVLDFGVARLGELGGLGGGLTGTGVVVGTPHFMAPEQASGAKAIDARADVFALGAVLYRCLTGRLPFAGRTPGEVMLRLLHDDPPRVRELRADVPAKLDDLVWRMLAKDPAQRPADATELLAELLGQERTPAPGEDAPRIGEITEEEQRAECVILVAGDANDAMRRVAAAHGGLLESVPGATAVTLASQRVATDQARFAARCALALRREQPGTAMALAIGRRRVRAASASHSLPTGLMAAAVNLLGEDAGAGIRIDANVAGLLDARFVVAGDGRGLVLHGELAGDDEARTLLGRPTPYVGRDQELSLLSSIFDGCVSESEARVVLVTAAPGMGKSRLRQELTRRLRDGDQAVEVWLGRADPMRAGAPFALLGEAVRRAAGIAGDEPLEERRRLLADRVARHVLAARAAQVAEFLGELAGVPFPAENSLQLRSARRDPRLLGDQMRAAFETWLDAECQAHPVVIVLEDLHWGDAPTVRFIDSALRALAERPLMVLALARPEVRETFPDLWSERGMQMLQLGELSRRASERLVRQVLGDAPCETVARIVERAGGNAFYLEELLRRVAEGGMDSLPETVLAMVEARLQALPTEARRVLRAASIFGEVFWTGALRSLLGGSDVEAALEELTQREVVRRHDRARFAGEDEYSFRHGLIREAAYAMLTDADRVVGHRLAGDWLEGAGESDALALAEHFQRGAQAPRAVTWYLRAAQQALASNDMAATVERAERGVACGAAGVELGQFRLAQAEAFMWAGNLPAAQRAGLEAVTLLPRGSATWFMAAGEAVAASGRMNDAENVRRLVAEVRTADDASPTTSAHAIAFARAAIQATFYLPVAESRQLIAPLRAAQVRFAEDPRVSAWLEQALAFCLVIGVGIEESLRLRARAAEHYREVGDRRNACLERGVLAVFLAFSGAIDEAVPIFLEVSANASEMGLEVARLVGESTIASVYLAQGDAATARAVAAAAMARMTQAIRSPVISTALCIEALALQRLDEPVLAEAKARQGLANLRPEMSRPAFLGTLTALILAKIGRLLVDRGHAVEVEALLGPLLQPGEGYAFAPSVYATHAHALRALGDVAGADRALAYAWQLLVGIAEGISDPVRREQFLDRGFGGDELRNEVRQYLGADVARADRVVDLTTRSERA